MKRFFLLILVFIASVTIGCAEEKSYIELQIFSINDFHGALYEDDTTAGIEKIGKYIKSQSKKNPTVVISAGDMFQGTAVSSMTRGRVVVEAMNEIGFDAMTIGNHEFDWGIDEILKYTDNDTENGEANFKFLAANIIDRKTNELASWATPYTVIEREELKIGVIGVIGQDQASDILASYVANYEFINPLLPIKEYTKILRNDENCDIVIVSTHFDSSDINNAIIGEAAEDRVDVIINGHTHQSYYGETIRSDGSRVPYVQSGSSGRFLGKVILKVDRETKRIIEVSAENIDTKAKCKGSDLSIRRILNNYKDEKKKSEEVLGKAGEFITRDSGARWAANAIQRQNNATVGIVNFGGIRADAFPIDANKSIDYANIFRVMPFENKVCIVSITGEQLLYIGQNTSLRFSSNINFSQETINNEKIVKTEYYNIATVDFVFENDAYPFLNGKDINRTDIIFREQLVADVLNQMDEYGAFYASK